MAYLDESGAEVATKKRLDTKGEREKIAFALHELPLVAVVGIRPLRRVTLRVAEPFDRSAEPH